MSATTILAPSAAIRRTDARPMPLAPPVTTATRPSSRPGTGGRVVPVVIAVVPSSLSFPRSCRAAGLSCRADEHVLGLGERGHRVRPEFPAEAGLLEPAERRGVPHRRV